MNQSGTTANPTEHVERRTGGRRAWVVRLAYIAALLLAPWESTVYGDESVTHSDAGTTDGSFERVGCAGIEVVYRIADDLYCGSRPANVAAFAALRDLGVRTIISVDGAAPNVECARRFEMRYVHLPLGYDGIDPVRQQQLTQCAVFLEKPIYVHCHFGKHRAPAAAAFMMARTGRMDPADALSILKRAGTSRQYDGLYRDVLGAKPVAKDQLQDRTDSLAETTPPEGLKKAMLAINRITSDLDRIQKANWRMIAQHPDLDPKSSAVQLAEQFRELARSLAKDSQHYSPDLVSELKDTERIAWRLAGDIENADGESLSQHFATLRASCRSCHARFRD